MTRQPYDAEVNARAVAWVARKTKPARVSAEELGCPARPGIGGWRPPGSTQPSRLWAMAPAVARTSGGGIWSGRSTILPKKTPS